MGILGSLVGYVMGQWHLKVECLTLDTLMYKAIHTCGYECMLNFHVHITVFFAAI
jgi:hypothetical protein